MIITLSGDVTHCGAGWLILDVGGLGYKIRHKISDTNYQKGEKLRFFVHHHVREDAEELYGFETLEELELFELLLSVSGVGPKMAMAVMSGAGPEKIQEAIVKGDSTLLTAISGVGRKLAAKIIVELKNKIGGLGEDYLPSESNDVVEALLSLGYHRPEILAVLKKMPADLEDSQAKIRWTLKNIK